MKEKDENEKNKPVEGASLRHEMADLFSGKADEKARNANEIKQAREKQLFELNNVLCSMSRKKFASSLKTSLRIMTLVSGNICWHGVN